MQTRMLNVRLKKDYKGFKAGTFLYKDREGKNIVFDLRDYKKNRGFTFSVEKIKKNTNLFDITYI